jgi:hypothetical protein
MNQELIDAIAADAGITKAAAISFRVILGNKWNFEKVSFTSRFRIMVSFSESC